MLIVVIGLPGTGKTTFSAALAEKTGALHLNTDIIRTELGLRGQYDEVTKARIYQQMLERAEKAILRGEKVVVDGTFYLEEIRAVFRLLALSSQVAIHWIELSAAEEVIRERVNEERPFSEADFSVYQKVKNAYEPLLEEHLLLETDGEDTLEELIQHALYYLKNHE